MLHIRNLPYETTEEELRELCAPFGRLVQSKLNVGANKNQAFVEFPDQASAINMVSYFASSADPAKVRRCYPRLLSGVSDYIRIMNTFARTSGTIASLTLSTVFRVCVTV